MTTNFKTPYGDIPIGRHDIRKQRCVSIDLRRQTGLSDYTDETRIVEPGMFTLSVFAPNDDELPVGEIRMIRCGTEVSLVGALTGRLGITEVTPDHIATAGSDPDYRKALLSWMEG
jgi:hypothetical protein